LSRINWDAVWDSLNWDSGGPQATFSETLAQRAEKYARPQERPEEAPEDSLRVLIFVQGGEHYAIPVGCVRQGLAEARVTPLPCVPSHYRGVINLRGRILSVLDLRRFWGLPSNEISGPARVLVVQAGALELAVLVDDVHYLAAISLQKIVPPAAAGIGLAHVQGVGPDGVVIVDVESLAADRRLRVHEELA